MTKSDQFSDVFYASKDGLRLHARVYGVSSNKRSPVVCLPGLTRNVRDFHELALLLSNDAETPRQIVAFDYRGRGGSQYDPQWTNYNILTEAEDVLAGLDALDIPAASFIGTSRGGLIIHMLGSLRLSSIKAVVFNDIGPVIESTGFAHIRSYLETAIPPQSFTEALQIQRSIYGSTFPGLTEADWHRMVAAIYRDENGRPVADFDPNLVNMLAGLDLSKPLPAMWQQFDALKQVPMLVIRGEHSRLFSTETIAQMQRRHPDLKAVTVSGQGHPPMLETGQLPRVIADFLARTESAVS